MLKVVLQILIITFFLVLFYDTVDICLNQINSKKENELLIVKREVEKRNQPVESVTSYETYEFSIWPIALGFSCVFCSVVCHFILPLKFLSVKKQRGKENPQNSLQKFNKKIKHYKQEEDEFSYFEEIDKDDSKHHFDIRIKDEVVYCKDLGLIASQDSFPENASKSVSLAQLNKAGQEKSIRNVCLPNLFNDEMFPAQSSIDVIKNMGLPATPSSFYVDENKRKHFSETFYEKNCEILTVNNAIFKENLSQRSEDSIDSLSIKQGQIMELLSVPKNDVTKPPKISTSDKSISVQLPTYSDNDIKNIKKRLENIEYGLRKSEERTKDWGNRINVAETELVDLHEQMYTIFSKFEEEKKTNYIIVSKLSKDKIFPKNENIYETVAEESDGSEQVDEKGEEDNISKNKIDEEVVTTPNPDSALTEKNSSEEESEDEDQSENDIKSNPEFNQKSIEESTELILTELKQRSIALESLLESKSRSQISTYLPKKKIPQLSVPRHIIPPYKRPSFAGTDSKAELRKRRLNMRINNNGNEFYWRTRMFSCSVGDYSQC
ncbi:unnamed protein product [Nezara viridula]|uniref:Uncharacterized protein n=2 Tax=Nezara viridula TaxID=85310 RepID=A0A9P0DZS8_NEZVI|nr:unnamed protein product [Nezara viridula]